MNSISSNIRHSYAYAILVVLSSLFNVLFSVLFHLNKVRGRRRVCLGTNAFHTKKKKQRQLERFLSSPHCLPAAALQGKVSDEEATGFPRHGCFLHSSAHRCHQHHRRLHHLHHAFRQLYRQGHRSADKGGINAEEVLHCAARQFEEAGEQAHIQHL